MSNDTDLNRQISMATMLTPVAQALIAHPGLGADQNTFTQASQTLLSNLKAATNAVTNQLVPEAGGASPQVNGMITKGVAEWVCTAWQKSAGEIDPDRLADLFKTLAETASPLPEEAFSDVPRATAKTLAVGKALAGCHPVWDRLRSMNPVAAKVLIGNNDAESFMQLIRNSFIENVDEITDSMLPSEHSEDESHATWLSVADIMSRIYESSIVKEFSDQWQEIRGMSNEGKRAHLKASSELEGGHLLTGLKDSVQGALKATLSPLGSLESDRDEDRRLAS